MNVHPNDVFLFLQLPMLLTTNFEHLLLIYSISWEGMIFFKHLYSSFEVTQLTVNVQNLLSIMFAANIMKNCSHYRFAV